MNKMTWREFKEFVDKELERQSASQDISIDFIDISVSSFAIEVVIDKENNDMAIH